MAADPSLMQQDGSNTADTWQDRIYAKIVRYLRARRAYPLLRVDFIRIAIVKWRQKYFIEKKKALRIWDGSKANLAAWGDKDAISHNLGGLHDISGCRGLRIIRPLSIIETYRPLSEMPRRSAHDLDYVCDAKVLCIGPRTEGEIFMLMAYGFAPENIRGLDLISYSPLIDVGDMHAMPYKDDEFDISISSCVLVYSSDPQLACKEIVRVTKNGGLACVAQDTVPSAGRHTTKSLGRPVISCDDYLELFDGHVDQVFFRHELPERLHEIDTSVMEGSNYTMSLIFRIKK